MTWTSTDGQQQLFDTAPEAPPEPAWLTDLRPLLPIGYVHELEELLDMEQIDRERGPQVADDCLSAGLWCELFEGDESEVQQDHSRALMAGPNGELLPDDPMEV